MPADPERTAVPRRSARLVVGIGASAGGLDAFRAFFAAMPADSGMVFVLVQHLDPLHDSNLATIVGGYTAMAVSPAADGAALEPDNVYVIPPNALLRVEGDRLRIESPAPQVARRTAIDIFLTSMAQEQGEDAVGIILSGFGSDGAIGVVAIKEHGGLTLSQAEFDHHAKAGMPQSAAAGGFVDHVLQAGQMPACLLDYRDGRVASDGIKGPDGLRQDLASHLPTICAVLHSRLGHDFSQYKTGTLMRRIQRRMQVLRTEEVSAYVAKLRSLPNEADLLFREILIGVTRFFRDPDAFAALAARVAPALFTEGRGTEPVRVWVAGCATGEEAYSVAILLREAVGRARHRRPVQIFASDLDVRAIEFARAGLYPASVVADLTTERLERNFVEEDGCYRVTKELREMCLFSVHDLAKDPPFSRLDLVSSRNVMIYFEAELQQRVLATFHYALRPDGHLFLGPSESVSAQSRIFAPLDKRYRIYQRRDVAAQLPAFSLSRTPDPAAPVRRTPPGDDEIDRRAARVIARYAPAFLVVDRNQEILRFSGQTARYLDPATGPASLNLFGLLHPSLRPAMRAALRQLAETGTRVLSEPVRIETAGPSETVVLIVEPLAAPGGDGLLVVAFQPAGGPAQAPDTDAAEAPADGGAIQAELQFTRDRLRTALEELEAANEELRSSNEEYLSVNEELQSANEELETSKEELQSLNEELQTINAELNQRNESLVRSNSDLANLFDNTSIATLFLDNTLRIRRFTPRLLEIFNVREGDEGRPITDIVTRLGRDGLGQDVRQVLWTLKGLEREVAVPETGMNYLMQVRPYRSLNNVVDGAVVTFVDITERKRDEQARALLAAIVQSSQDAILSHDLDGTITSWNGGAEQLYGYTAAEAVGHSMAMLQEQRLLRDWQAVLAKLQEGEPIARTDTARTAKDGRQVEVSISVSPVLGADGRLVGASVVARDISERRAAEQRAALMVSELDHRVRNVLAIVSSLVGRTLRKNPTPQAAAAELGGRIKAIGDAHGLLIRAGTDALSLRAIMAAELAPYEGGTNRLTVSGPDIELTRDAGLAVAVAVHELATNAVKYGGLSTEDGGLDVAWTLGGDAGHRTLTFVWTETGGPAVQAPSGCGFGTTLIDRVLASELGAVVTRAFPVSGLVCTFVLTLPGRVG